MLYINRRTALINSDRYPKIKYILTDDSEGIEGTDYEIVKETNENGKLNGNWKIRLLNSGSIIFLNGSQIVDLFLVGGGGGGGGGYDNGPLYMCYGGGGGGGGYTETVKNITLSGKNEYTATIGAGGSAGIANGSRPTKGTDGGNSIFNKEITALGGKGGEAGGSGNSLTDSRGGDGGSGGGAGGSGSTSSSTSMAGGEDGNNGGNFTINNNPKKYGGTGQGTTTREFSEENGTLYSTGGNGGQYTSSPIEPVAKSNNTGDGGNGGGISGSFV